MIKNTTFYFKTNFEQKIFSVILFFLCFSQARAENFNLKQMQVILRHQHAKELVGSHSFDKIKEKVNSSYYSENFHFQISKLLRDKKNARLIGNTILNVSDRYGFDPIFLAALIHGESNFNSRAIGSVGEIGLMQIRPETAKWIAHKFSIKYNGKNSLFNPEVNIKIGAAYLHYLRKKFRRNSSLYIAAYNMGARNVHRALKRNILPKDYSRHVMKRYFSIYREFEFEFEIDREEQLAVNIP